MIREERIQKVRKACILRARGWGSLRIAEHLNTSQKWVLQNTCAKALAAFEKERRSRANFRYRNPVSAVLADGKPPKWWAKLAEKHGEMSPLYSAMQERAMFGHVRLRDPAEDRVTSSSSLDSPPAAAGGAFQGAR